MKKFRKIINSTIPTLVDFYANWCAPCRMMAPLFEQLKKEWGNNLRIIKIELDSNPRIAGYYNIRSIPAILFFKEGKTIWTGMGSRSFDDINKEISKFIQFQNS